MYDDIDYKKDSDHTCRRCGKPSDGFHPCPYAQEINDDDTPCNCCECCEEECAMDI